MTTKKTSKKTSTSVSLTWEEPPTSGRARLSFPADELKKRKGEWACIYECEAQSTAGGRATSLRKAHKEEGFEIRSSGVKVYARYVG